MRQNQAMQAMVWAALGGLLGAAIGTLSALLAYALMPWAFTPDLLYALPLLGMGIGTIITLIFEIFNFAVAARIRRRCERSC